MSDLRDCGRSVRYVRYVIVLLTVVNIFNYIDRMALAVLLPSIKEDLGLSDGQLGLLTGFAFSLFYAICGIPIARWADRGIRRNIIALALAVWSLMTALSGAAQNFWHLFVTRVGVGAGEAGGVAPAQSMLCDYVPPQRRAGVFAVHSFGLIAGMMLGMMLAGALGDAIGWRWTFVALGLPGIALAVVVRCTLREPRRGRFDAVQEDAIRTPFGRTIAIVWRCGTYRLLMYYFIVNGFVVYGFSQWLPSFYARVFELSMSSIGIYLGMAIGAGSAAGTLIGGFLANKGAQREVRWPLRMSGAATALALPAALGMLFVQTSSASMFLVGVTWLFLSVPAGAAVASVYNVTQPRMRATAGAITIFFSSVLGFGLGPSCVGLLSDLLTPSLGGEALRYALLAPMGLIPAITIALWAASRALPRDLTAAGTQTLQ